MMVWRFWISAVVTAALFRLARTKLQPVDAFVVDAGQCNTGHITNIGLLNTLDELRGYNIQGDCLPAGGFQPGTAATSKGTLASLSKRLGSKGFSVELWIQPLRRLVSATAPILSFGGDKVSTYACANNFVVYGPQLPLLCLHKPVLCFTYRSVRTLRYRVTLRVLQVFILHLH
jgi:hypothetical protein